jgi:hypothetical protein
MSRSDYANPGYWLRLGLSIDDLGQAITNRGIPNVSISARSGTAEWDYEHGAHEKHHLWGVYLSWLLDRVWPFGLDPKTGERHVVGAVHGDRWRNFNAIVALWNYYPDSELAAAMLALATTQLNRKIKDAQ